MAVNYANLFTGLGEFVQRADEYVSIYTTLTNGLSEIATDLQGISRQDIFSGTPEIFDGFRAAVLSWIATINAKAGELLTERESILEELELEETTIQAVLAEMFRDMVDNAQTIKRNVVTIGAITDDKVNANAGSIMVDKVLDGVSNPHGSFSANWEYAGRDSELSDTDEMFVEVITDSDSDGATEGNEVLQVFGRVATSDRYSWETFGSGAGPTLSPIQGASLMTNLEMEGFTSDVPDGWTLDNGTAGVHVIEENVTTKRGVDALEFAGDGAEATIQISQAIPGSTFKPRQRYVVGFWIRGQMGTSSGTLTIQFEGTGYTAGATEKISLNSAALAAMTSYTWNYFFVNMPDVLPTDMELVIKWTGTPSAHTVHIDGGGVAIPAWHNGVAFAAYAGSEKFVKNDRFSVAITQSGAGVFQNWFRKALGVQMPAVGGGAETISDTLAT